MKEFKSLSEKEAMICDLGAIYYKSDIKEFINICEKECCSVCEKVVRKHAGDKLITKS